MELNTSGFLQSKYINLQETGNIHDSMNRPKIEVIAYTVEPVLNRHSLRPEIGFNNQLSLNTGQKY